jgi:hypothetical protein
VVVAVVGYGEGGVYGVWGRIRNVINVYRSKWWVYVPVVAMNFK